MLPSYQLKLNFAFLDLSTLKERLKQIYVDLSEKSSRVPSRRKFKHCGIPKQRG